MDDLDIRIKAARKRREKRGYICTESLTSLAAKRPKRTGPTYNWEPTRTPFIAPVDATSAILLFVIFLTVSFAVDAIFLHPRLHH